jgi:hypothetical protein
MNNTFLLSGIGILLTVVAFLSYLRWRRSPQGISSVSMLSALIHNRALPDARSGDSGKSPALPKGSGFLAGTVRRPIDEVKLMFAAWILLGIPLTVVSLVLRNDIQDSTQDWIAFPFLILGLAAAVGGAYLGERLDREGWAERIAAFLAYWLGVDIVQFTCLIGGAVFLLLAAIAAVICGWGDGRTTIVISAALGILLGVVGIWRPRLARLFSRKTAPAAAGAPIAVEPPAAPGTLPAPARTAGAPVRRRRQTPVRRRESKSRRS